MQHHSSFLVRLWWRTALPADASSSVTESRAANEPPTELRITALDPQTGEQWGFAAFDELLTFFSNQVRHDDVKTQNDKGSFDKFQ